MSTLILYLPESLPPTDGASLVLQHLITQNGRSALNSSSTATGLLPEQGFDDVVAVVPVTRLSWQRVSLPRGTLTRKGMADPARLRAVLAGTLEDLLLDEPETLHFALSPQSRDGEPCTVAVCDRAWLRAWLQLLEVHEHLPARIVPELAPPADGADEFNHGVLHVLARWGCAWVAWPSGGVLALLPLDASSVELIQWPVEAPVLAEPAVAEQAEQMLGRRVGLQPQVDRWLAANRSDWDLSQLEWANAHARRNRRRVGAWLKNLWWAPAWRAARWSALVLAAVNLIGLNAWAWAQRDSLKAKQAHVSSILQQSFPQVKVVIDAPVQMRRELSLRRQSSGQGGVGDAETLLTAVVGAGQTVPTAIDYSAGELRLSGWTLTDAEQTDARRRLAVQGVDMLFLDGAVVLRGKENP